MPSVARYCARRTLFCSTRSFRMQVLFCLALGFDHAIVMSWNVHTGKKKIAKVAYDMSACVARLAS